MIAKSIDAEAYFGGAGAGVVLVPCGGQQVSDETVHSIERLTVPPGTWPNALKVGGSDIVANRNALFESALALLPSLDWALCLDADQTVEPYDLGTLLRASAESGAAIVSAAVIQRGMPFCLNAYVDVKNHVRLVRKGHPPDAVVPVEAVGAGCLLVRRRAIDALFRGNGTWWRGGAVSERVIGEDIDFTHRAHEKGLGVAVAMRVKAGHQFRGTLYHGDDGRVWMRMPGPEDFRIPLDGIGEA